MGKVVLFFQTLAAWQQKPWNRLLLAGMYRFTTARTRRGSLKVSFRYTPADIDSVTNPMACRQRQPQPRRNTSTKQLSFPVQQFISKVALQWRSQLAQHPYYHPPPTSSDFQSRGPRHADRYIILKALKQANRKLHRCKTRGTLLTGCRLRNAKNQPLKFTCARTRIEVHRHVMCPLMPVTSPRIKHTFVVRVKAQ